MSEYCPSAPDDKAFFGGCDSFAVEDVRLNACGFSFCDGSAQGSAMAAAEPLETSSRSGRSVGDAGMSSRRAEGHEGPEVSAFTAQPASELRGDAAEQEQKLKIAVKESQMESAPGQLGMASILEQKVHTLLEEQNKLQADHRTTWERESEVLDTKERQIHQTQMKLMRQQMTSLSSYMASLKDRIDEIMVHRERDIVQVQNLQEEICRDRQEMSDDIMSSLRHVQEEHGSKFGELHGHHATIQERLAFLEQTIGDSADKHAEDLAALRADHSFLSTGFTQHAREVEAFKAMIPEQLGHFNRRLDEAHGGHSQRFDELHDRLHAFETQSGTWSDVHSSLSSDVEKLSAAHAFHQESLSTHAKLLDNMDGTGQGRHNALEGRLGALEELLSSHADQHSKHSSALQDLEAASGSHADRHSSALEELAAKLEHAHGRLAACEDPLGALHESHKALEQTVMQSANRHAKKLCAFKMAHEKHAAALSDHSSTLEAQLAQSRELCAALAARLDVVERQHSNTSDRHAKKLYSLSTGHEKHLTHLTKCLHDLDFINCDHTSRHASLAERLDAMDQLHGEARDTHSAGLSQIQSKFDAMHERLLGDFQRSHEELAGRNAQLASGHASVGERLEYLEKMLGDSADKHDQELQALQDVHSRHNSDLAGLRSLHEDLSSQHGATLAELQQAHSSLQDKKMELESHHSSLKERVEYLEGLLNDSADQHADKLDAAHVKMEELHGRLAAHEQYGPLVLELQRSHVELVDCTGKLVSDHSAMTGRLGDIEAGFGDHADRHGQELESLKALHEQHAASMAAHREQHATLPERVEYLEKQIGDSADHHVAAVEDLHRRLEGELATRDAHHGSMRDLFAREQEERGMHHVSMGERLDHLEGIIGDKADKHTHDLQQMLRGHERLVGEVQAAGENHGGIMERIAQLEVTLQDMQEHHSRELRKQHAKLNIIKDAWAQETPRD